MKIQKSGLIFLVILLVFSLFAVGCGNRMVSEEKANDYIDATAYRDGGTRRVLTGRVTKIGAYSLHLIADEGFGTLSGREIRVALSEQVPFSDAEGGDMDRSALKEGDRVQITYDGSVLASDPPRVSKCYGVRALN